MSVFVGCLLCDACLFAAWRSLCLVCCSVMRAVVALKVGCFCVMFVVVVCCVLFVVVRCRCLLFVACRWLVDVC